MHSVCVCGVCIVDENQRIDFITGSHFSFSLSLFHTILRISFRTLEKLHAALACKHSGTMRFGLKDIAAHFSLAFRSLYLVVIDFDGWPLSC